MWLVMGNKTHKPEGTRRRQVTSRYLTMQYTILAPVDTHIKHHNSAEINFISVNVNLLLYKQQFTKCIDPQY